MSERQILPTTALRLAREFAVPGRSEEVRFAARPVGAIHLYAGRVTTKGNVPATCRPLCGQGTRRLRTFGPPANVLTVPVRQLCRTCVRVVTTRAANAGQPAGSMLRRADILADYSTATVAQTVDALQQATTLARVNHLAYLSIVLFPAGHPDITTAIHATRRRLGEFAAADAATWTS